jgi:hypothetical protein
VALIADNGGRENVQALTVERLEGPETQEVVVGLGEGGVVLLRGEVAERRVVLSLTH